MFIGGRCVNFFQPENCWQVFLQSPVQLGKKIFELENSSLQYQLPSPLSIMNDPYLTVLYREPQKTVTDLIRASAKNLAQISRKYL